MSSNPALVDRLLREAGVVLQGLEGRVIDVLSVRKPLDEEEALGWAPIISKISPLVGNLLEYDMVRVLNDTLTMPSGIEWERQDPLFPDAGLMGVGDPTPGIEIKAWFPLATEMTGRFRESQDRLKNGDVRLAVVAWLPEYVVFGSPKVLGVFYEDAMAVARARDEHYHHPPAYLVIEPEDTSARTRNLQQTNTSGHRLQESANDVLAAAKAVVAADPSLLTYSTDPAFQADVRKLLSRFQYRLDTNYAKIDRVDHRGLEAFKSRILNMDYHGLSIVAWASLIAKDPDTAASHIMRLAAAAP